MAQARSAYQNRHFKQRRFNYNPFQDADIYIYPPDKDVRKARRYRLYTVNPLSSAAKFGFPYKEAKSIDDVVFAVMDEMRQITVYVNGAITEMYSIKFKGRRTKKRFSSY